MSKKIKTGSPVGRPKNFTNPDTGELETIKDSDIPKPYSPLGADGMRWWMTIWKHGSHLDLNIDTLLLEDLCQAVDEMQEMRRALATGQVSKIQTTSNGTIIVHPFVNQVKEYRVQIRSWMSNLGIGPTERLRLGLNDALDNLTSITQMFESAVLDSQMNKDDEQEDDEQEDGEQ